MDPLMQFKSLAANELLLFILEQPAGFRNVLLSVLNRMH
jgi:hypothetical protein